MDGSNFTKRPAPCRAGARSNCASRSSSSAMPSASAVRLLERVEDHRARRSRRCVPTVAPSKPGFRRAAAPGSAPPPRGPACRSIAYTAAIAFAGTPACISSRSSSRRSLTRATTSSAVRPSSRSASSATASTSASAMTSCLAHDVHVPLEVLAQPPALRALVAEELRDREPADRLAQPARARAHHPRERGRHLRPQRDLPPALVLEVVELADDLRAALLDVELERFERRAVVLLEPVAPRDLAPRVDDVRANGKVFGVEIPESRQTSECRHGARI